MLGKALDALYEQYGFSVQQSRPQLRVYLLRQGYFHGAEIVPLEPDSDVGDVEKEYLKGGYATRVRRYRTILEAQQTLFDGFFRPKAPV